MLRQVHDATLSSDLKNHVIFVEDYDINVGRHLVQGVDVWLNNPRRPQEASGTSGQKVLLNGGLNMSVLDGWWAEAYDGLNGFAIGDGITHVSVEEQDRRDAASLYETLENVVVPLYYDRDETGVPRGWIERMKRTIRTLGWRFNTDRMVIVKLSEARVADLSRVQGDRLVLQEHFVVVQQARERVAELAREAELCMGDGLSAVTLGGLKDEAPPPTDNVFDPTRPPTPGVDVSRPPEASPYR